MDGENRYTPPEATDSPLRQAIEGQQNTAAQAGREPVPPSAEPSPLSPASPADTDTAPAEPTSPDTSGSADEPGEAPDDHQENHMHISNETARATGLRLIRQKERALRRSQKPLTDDQFKIMAAYHFREGLGEEKPYRFVDDQGREIRGIPINLQVATAEDNAREVNIILLKKAHTENGRRIYICNAKDPADPTRTIEVKVAADQIVDRYMAAEAKSISQNFADEGTRALIQWSLGSADTSLPEEARAAAEQESNPINRADRVIDGEIQRLQELLQKEDLPKKDLQALQQRIRYFQFARHEANGELAAFVKASALRAIDQANIEDPEEYQDIVDNLRDGEKRGRQALHTKLTEAGFTTEEIDRIGNDFSVVLTDSALLTRFLAIEGIDQMVLGKQLGENEIQDFMNKYLTKDVQDALRELNINWENIRSGGLIALLVALVAAGVVVVGTAGGALMIEQGLGKAMTT